ncbi:MAG: polysaccharide ABC transporter ATP-binding protein [Chloroflexi bacterium HGW-Chloroflexi-10]|nr:MAG: polysaccharide ABC transporter ATP-binding protein [Chloroflexi bacterium HGW-Chloroflexi-10]
MQETTQQIPLPFPKKSKFTLKSQLKYIGKIILKYRWLYILMAPGLIYFLLFRYWPLWNAQIAFKDFKPLLGVEGSPFIGFKHFIAFFNSFYFSQLIGNTIIFSTAKLILGIPIAVMLALALYESNTRFFRSFVQTVAYLPHFLSWVIMFGVLLVLLSPANGLINEIIKATGHDPIPFLMSPEWFRVVVVGSDIWKETGWSTILYLAALMGLDPTLFEAAAVDGASRIQRIWHISLPGILGVIVVVTLLRLGNILDAGFNQIFVLYSLPVYSVGDILDTWVYRQGILEFQFSLATAVGLFKGFIGLALVYFSNRLAKKIAGSSLY